MNDNFRGEELGNFQQYFSETEENCIACNTSSPNLWALSGSFKAVKCINCNLIWMNPYSSKEGLDLYYKNYIGRRRLNNDLKMEQRKIQYEDDALFIERFISDGKILDIGCNGGFFLEVLNNKFEKHGIEIDPEAVKFAKNTFKDFGSNIICESLENAPYENSTFDMISMRGTIEHMPDPLSAIKKVSELLKKDGLFGITATPTGVCLAADLYRDKWTLFHPIQHIWHFNPKSFSLICERFGLKLVSKEFPYIDTPYASVKDNLKEIAGAIDLRSKDSEASLQVSPPFFESMMSLMYKKI